MGIIESKPETGKRPPTGTGSDDNKERTGSWGLPPPPGSVADYVSQGWTLRPGGDVRATLTSPGDGDTTIFVEDDGKVSDPYA